jgi:predicted DNA-binding ribbon-helix-helix protein
MGSFRARFESSVIVETATVNACGESTNRFKAENGQTTYLTQCPRRGGANRLAAQQDCEAGSAGISFQEKTICREEVMCHLFAHQPQRDYESQTRSLRIGGHCTSIRLEMSFWDTLEEIAAKENMSLGKFLTTLHTEVLDHHGEVKNFASLLRCSCLIYRARSAAALPEFQRAEAAILDAAE